VFQRLSARTRHARGTLRNYKTTQQQKSWLLLDYRVRFNIVRIVIRDILRYERIENSSFRNVQQLYSVFDSISVVARCLIITSCIISVFRVSINYTSYYQRTGVCRRRIGIYHLRLILCVPNIYIEIPLPHQNHLIQGLNPEIRLHVLHTGADSIDGILEAARVSEMAHTANTTQPIQIEELATQVRLLVNKISAQTTIDTPRSPTARRVSFSQTAIATPAMREPSSSPINRSRTPDDNRGRRSNDQSAPTPPGVRTEYRRQSPRRTFDDEPYARRETSFHRNEPSPQRDTQPWRTPQSYTSTSTSNATYNRPAPYDRETSTSSSAYRPGYRATSNTCSFCGNNHAMGSRFCPASNMQCYRCSKMGHMAKVCRSRPAPENSNRFNSR
jgi:hypothetical protein